MFSDVRFIILISVLFLASIIIPLMILRARLKKLKRNFINEMRAAFRSAVYEYENNSPDGNPLPLTKFETWRKRHSYLVSYIEPNYSKLGLDEEYETMINKYCSYIENRTGMA